MTKLIIASSLIGIIATCLFSNLGEMQSKHVKAVYKCSYADTLSLKMGICK